MRTKVVLLRPEYSLNVYSPTYKLRFSPGRKQVSTPLQLMQLGGAVVAAGHDVRIIDGEAENLENATLAQRIVAERPDVVGVTCTTPEYHTAKDLIVRIRQALPTAIIVIGGAHATHVPWQLADEIAELDYIVMNEGERALVAVANGDVALLREYATNALAVMDLVGADYSSNARGRVLLGPAQTQEDLESISPVRALPYIDMRFYRYCDPEHGLVITDSVETARGCPFGCTFCSSARSGLTMRSIPNVLDELQALNSRFRAMGSNGFVVFLDDTLTFSRPRARELFEGMARRGLSLHCTGFTRANTIATKYGIAEDIDFVRLMRRVGFRSISFGIETGSEHLNSALNKGVALDDYRKAYRILRRAGFEEMRGSFIVGNPYETEQTVQESIRFAKELKLHRVGVNIMTPYPGTDAFDDARHGRGLYFEPNANDYQNYRRWGQSVVSTESLNPRALEYWHARFLAEVYGSRHCIAHALGELRNGNLSFYYHRPVTSGAFRQLRMRLDGQWDRPPKFSAPDHRNYRSRDWGQAHVRKSDCRQFLRQRYYTVSAHALNLAG